MNVSQTSAGAPPRCFGLSWDPNDVDCSGGYNPAFRGADGSRQQPRCDFFEACKGRVTLTKIEQLQREGNLIRPEVLVRAQQAAAQVPVPMVRQEEKKNEEKKLEQGQQQHIPMYAVPWMLAQGMSMTGNPSVAYYPTPAPKQAERQETTYYREQLAPSPAIHPYLAIPEPRRKGESKLKPLGRELVRAAFKAMFQTGANYFDFVTIGSEETD